MEYKVGPIREAGLEAKWGKSRGAPIILARKPKTSTWWYVDKSMWTRAQEVGIMQAFEEHTALGEYFSIRI
jgi:hypothetical protein